MSNFDGILNRLAVTHREPEDYTGEDGLLYCGKCHTPKQFRMTAPPMEGRILPCPCQCEKERQEQEAAEQENADTAVANEASQGIQVLASYTLAEAQIENLVTAKGYTDCVAFMGDECVSVVVSTKSGDLTAEDVAKITDITMTETGLPAGNIKIMAAN